MPEVAPLGTSGISDIQPQSKVQGTRIANPASAGFTMLEPGASVYQTSYGYLIVSPSGEQTALSPSRNVIRPPTELTNVRTTAVSEAEHKYGPGYSGYGGYYSPEAQRAGNLPPSAPQPIIITDVQKAIRAGIIQPPTVEQRPGEIGKVHPGEIIQLPGKKIVGTPEGAQIFTYTPSEQLKPITPEQTIFRLELGYQPIGKYPAPAEQKLTTQPLYDFTRQISGISSEYANKLFAPPTSLRDMFTPLGAAKESARITTMAIGSLPETFIGLPVYGAEMMFRDISAGRGKEVPSRVSTGLGSMATGFVESFQEKPIETLGTMAVQAALFSGVGKSIKAPSIKLPVQEGYSKAVPEFKASRTEPIGLYSKKPGRYEGYSSAGLSEPFYKSGAGTFPQEGAIGLYSKEIPFEVKASFFIKKGGVQPSYPGEIPFGEAPRKTKPLSELYKPKESGDVEIKTSTGQTLLLKQIPKTEQIQKPVETMVITAKRVPKTDITGYSTDYTRLREFSDIAEAAKVSRFKKPLKAMNFEESTEYLRSPLKGIGAVSISSGIPTTANILKQYLSIKPETITKVSPVLASILIPSQITRVEPTQVQETRTVQKTETVTVQEQMQKQLQELKNTYEGGFGRTSFTESRFKIPKPFEDERRRRKAKGKSKGGYFQTFRATPLIEPLAGLNKMFKAPAKRTYKKSKKGRR